MKSDLWIIFTIISGFMGFLLGYSTPPMMEVGLGGSHDEIATTGEQESSTEQDMTDYYKQLQELQ